jgi:hypothetical protein
MRVIAYHKPQGSADRLHLPTPRCAYENKNRKSTCALVTFVAPLRSRGKEKEKTQTNDHARIKQHHALRRRKNENERKEPCCCLQEHVATGVPRYTKKKKKKERKRGHEGKSKRRETHITTISFLSSVRAAPSRPLLLAKEKKRGKGEGGDNSTQVKKTDPHRPTQAHTHILAISLEYSC